MKILARKSALSYKANDNAIKVIEDFTFEQPHTKAYVEILKNFNIYQKKSLLVLNKNDKNVYLSARNIPKTKVTTVNSLNTYEILNAGTILLSESSLPELEKWLVKENKVKEEVS